VSCTPVRFASGPSSLFHEPCGSLKIEQQLPHYSSPIWRTRVILQPFSLERRWSSRTFRYGYLVTT
jgi:hypothetical protein